MIPNVNCSTVLCSVYINCNISMYTAYVQDHYIQWRRNVCTISPAISFHRLPPGGWLPTFYAFTCSLLFFNLALPPYSLPALCGLQNLRLVPAIALIDCAFSIVNCPRWSLYLCLFSKAFLTRFPPRFLIKDNYTVRISSPKRECKEIRTNSFFPYRPHKKTWNIINRFSRPMIAGNWQMCELNFSSCVVGE